MILGNRPRARAFLSRCQHDHTRESRHDVIGCAVRRIRPRLPEPRDTQTKERRECQEKECEGEVGAGLEVVAALREELLPGDALLVAHSPRA